MEFNFKKYVMEQRTTGRSDKQIATSLGMSLKHFLAKVEEEIEHKNPIVETFKEQMTNTILKPKKNKEPEVVKTEVVESNESVVTEEPQEIVEES